MTKTQVGLGVLSIPQTFDSLGLIPGVICLLAVAVITTWSDYMIGVFKRRHPQVYGLDDAGQLMFGRPGREFLAVVFLLCEFQVSTVGPFTSRLLLMLFRLDFRRWFRNVKHLDWLELGVNPRSLHRRFRRCCCGARFSLR